MSPPSTLGVKTPPPDNYFHKDVDEWLNDKRATDGAEELWRVHDGLYDLTQFIKMHPGGQFWLEETKGTDITEAFESHHISKIPEDLLKYYYVREAKAARASPFTFNEDGFYKTLKRNVRIALKSVPNEAKTSSNNFADALLLGTFIFAIVANTLWNYTFGFVSGILFAATIVAAHNYSHQRDNFRMYYSDICMENSRTWRIVHVLSHHLFTNTIADLQVFTVEPIIIFYPQNKSFITRYGPFIYAPLLLWPIRYPLDSIKNDRSLLSTILMWEFILAVGSFAFATVGFTAAHFHPDLFMDGDKARSEDDRDWGISQLDCVADRREVTGNRFLVLVTFGDHALHHLFPTLDHGVLPHLYPVVQETMKQFDIDIRMTTQVDMFTGFFKQIARVEPNPNPPGFKT